MDLADDVYGAHAESSTPAGLGHTAAAVVVAGAACLIAVLPALVVAGVVPGDGFGLVAVVAGLVAAVGGVKLVATAWALAAAFD